MHNNFLRGEETVPTMSLKKKIQQKKQMQDNNRKVLVHETVETYINSVNNSGSVDEQDRFTVEGEMGKELQKIAEEYFKRDHKSETQMIINRYLNEEGSLYELPFFWDFKTFPGLQDLFRPVWDKTYWPPLNQKQLARKILKKRNAQTKFQDKTIPRKRK